MVLPIYTQPTGHTGTGIQATWELWLGSAQVQIGILKLQDSGYAAGTISPLNPATQLSEVREEYGNEVERRFHFSR